MTEGSFHEVVVIGAGPAGSVVSAMLRKRGVEVLILEAQRFPRFSIGESLLPYCMTHISEAGMLDKVAKAGFQFKDGARFQRGGAEQTFDFTTKYGPGPGTTFQVKRAEFDQLLADEAARQGVQIRYGHRIEGVDLAGGPKLTVAADDASRYQLECRFLLDASGFGRVLPRLLDLESPSGFPVRTSIFTHIKDGITDQRYDRNKILIAVHPQYQDVWFWLIPFSDGRASVGVVAEDARLQQYSDQPDQALKALLAQEPNLAGLLAAADYDTEVRRMSGYAANVKALWGKGFALLGNAGEFLDPVFSSGVTIAMQSAGLAAPLVAKELRGEAVDWELDYAQPLKQGVDTFRVFVEAWYDGRFQDVIFASKQNPEVASMICAILAGYAWNTDNPYVARTRKRFDALVELCRGL